MNTLDNKENRYRLKLLEKQKNIKYSYFREDDYRKKYREYWQSKNNGTFKKKKSYPNNRNMDILGEKAFSLFFDKYYYSALFPKNIRLDENNTTNKDLIIHNQINGVDIFINHKNYGNLVVDEKFTLTLLNDNIPSTYAFELFFNDRSNKRRVGWFLNKDLYTDTYLLTYPFQVNIDENNPYVLDEKQIVAVDSILIQKKEIQKYLLSLGITDEYLKNMSEYLEQMYNYNKTKKVFLIEGNKDLYLTYSPYFKEKPVNLIIRRKTLEYLSELVCTTTREGTTVLYNRY